MENNNSSNPDVLLLTAVDPYSYQIIPDLGLLYLASVLRKAGHEVAVLDCRKERMDFEDLEEYISSFRPMVAGIKSYSNEADSVKRMTDIIRSGHPECVIMIGGPHPSMNPSGTLEHMPCAEYAFIGEAEKSIAPFVSWIKEGGSGVPPQQIPGIAFRSHGMVHIREPELEPELDRLPFPAWDLMPPDQYPDEAAGVFVPEFPAAPLMLSRGCPFRCNYCGCRYISGGKIRYRSVSNIMDEIDLLEESYGVKTFTFVDDNFTWHRERAMELFQALAEREKPVNFTFPNGVRVDSLDPEMLKLMEKAGCHLLALGIESGSNLTLERMNKKQTVEDIEEAVAMVREHTRIMITGFFILGYPGETTQDVKQTIRFASRLPVHHAHFCIFIPIPGTPVYQDLAEKGLIEPQSFNPNSLTIDRPSLDSPDLPARKLLRLHQYAYLRFYTRPWRVRELLGQIRSGGHLRLISRRVVKLFK